jgi:hypothetical protein
MVCVFLFDDCLVAAFCGFSREYFEYAVFVNSDAVVQQAGITLADGEYPAGMQKCIDSGHAAKIPAVLPGRKGVAIM